MTVSSTTSKASYSGNGSTTVFTVPFYFLAAADLQVILRSSAGVETVQTLTSQYTVAGAGVPSGGTVTMLTAPPSGTTLTILRNAAATQETDLLPNDRLPAESLETALDKLTMLVQQGNVESARALKIQITEQSVSTALPKGVANNLLGWNASANGFQNVPPSNLVTIVAYGSTNADLFNGNGSQTSFALTANPASQSNLDVSIGGITQRPGIDFVWLSGTTITFTTPPAVGTNNILVRYAIALPVGTVSASNVTKFSGGSVQDFVTLGESVIYKPNQSVFVDSLAFGDGLRNMTDTGGVSGHFDTAFGIKALENLTVGYGNTALGSSALKSTTTGYDNTAIGYEPLIANVDGFNNTGIAPKALYSNVSGYRNIAVGTTSLYSNVIGNENVAVGVDALFNSTSSSNVAVGHSAADKLTTGARNTAVGFRTLGSFATTTTGDDNTAVGYRAIFSLTSGLDNTGIGRDALVSLTSGNNNVAIGRDSLLNVVSGNNNVAVGNSALQLATGSSNVAIGNAALDAITSATGNVAVGHNAGGAATSGGQTLIGFQAGFAISTGQNNTAIGNSSAASITIGVNNTMLGYSSDGLANGDNQTSVGYGATCSASNQVTLGDSNVTEIRAPGPGFKASLTNFTLNKTSTAGGTTGAQTINKPAGSVNFAAAAASLVVTNSLVTTSSIVIATVATVDATMKSVSAVSGSGSFTLTANAVPTAETRVNFIVIN